MRVHVAVAVILNQQNEVLLALRQAHQHQGNYWEFPGGKVEASEQVYDALVREIKEELDLSILQATPLLQQSHDYADKSVLLDVWLVSDFSGKPIGNEGQRLRWCKIKALDSREFPAANVVIIDALQSLA